MDFDAAAADLHDTPHRLHPLFTFMAAEYMGEQSSLRGFIRQYGHMVTKIKDYSLDPPVSIYFAGCMKTIQAALPHPNVTAPTTSQKQALQARDVLKAVYPHFLPPTEKERQELARLGLEDTRVAAPAPAAAAATV